tara:strand:+ start:320 stop:547 length:228 start_codon:yes stop_codon:yes gene_type:complete
MAFKMKGPTFFNKNKTAIEAAKEVDMTKDIRGTEKDKYLAKLRGEYYDTKDIIEEDDVTDTVVSKDPSGPFNPKQ